MVKTVAQFIQEANAKREEILARASFVSTEVDMKKIACDADIISVTRFFAKKIIELFKDVPLLIIASDENGVIIDMVGDGELKEAMDDRGIKYGFQFTERALGANIVNLSLRHHWSAVEITGNSHHHPYLQEMACYGIVFKNTDTDDLLGTFSVMTTLENQRAEILTMLAIVGESIEREIMLKKRQKELEYLHQVMMANNQYGVLTTNRDGRIAEFNISAERLLNKKVDEMIGESVDKLHIMGDYIISVLSDSKQYDNVQITIETEEGKANTVLLFDTSPIYDDKSKVIGAFAQFRDITAQFRIRERFNHLANHDDQTGLPNRRFLTTKLTELLDERKGNEDECQLAVVYVDLDRFKIVNDTLGHTDGDHVLKRIVKRLVDVLEPDEIVARVGGDEFIVIVPCECLEEVSRIGERILSAFKTPILFKGYDFHVTASMGIAIFPENGRTKPELLMKADTAMFHAKSSGKNQYIIYSDELDPNSHAKILLENALRNAIDLGELFLCYQPQLDIQEGRIIGVEALVRWQHPELGLIPPSEFIPIAEESGIITQLDEWVLRKACEQNKKWQDMGIPPFGIAVNLSSSQFAHEKIVALVDSILQETGLEPKYLELEITETMTMDVEHAIPTLKRLSALGVEISIDDFGTGYSSMNYLTKFSVDRLKIDRSFIWNIEKSASDSNIVITIIRLAHSLGLKVLAEGVEDEKQFHFLRENGCDEVQGFLFSKPIRAEELETKITQLYGGYF